MLTRLAAITGTDVWAFADDAVVACDDMHTMQLVTKEIDTFSDISGFGVNRDKSRILHTMPTTPHNDIQLEDTGWEGVAFANTAVYLSVLIGVDISTEDIYAES